jgi:HEAT repeat protein
MGGHKHGVDDKILWDWWWEHNKDRYIARATERGRVNAGSSYYWFGAGAKYPPREIVPVSEAQRSGAIFPALKERLTDQPEVRAEAYIALGRLRFVAAADADKKEGEPDNMIVRTLIAGLAKETDAMVRQSAVLAFGICGDPGGCDHLLRGFETLQLADKPYALIAFGLARHGPAIPLILENLPGTGGTAPTDVQVAAIHALGLYGPEFVEEMNKEGRKGVEKLSDLAKSRQAKESVVVQAVAALGRLRQDLGTVKRRAGDKSNNIQWTAILAMGSYYGNEEDASAAFKELTQRAGKGQGQSKNNAILAMGELANRMDPNSKTRDAILKFLAGKDGLGKKGDNYIRACSALALGMARDRTAIDPIGELITDTTADDYCIAAACVALGLLRDASHADVMIREILRQRKKGVEVSAYALIALALAGDTTRLAEIRTAADGELGKERDIKKQVTLALGILGDRAMNQKLPSYFAKPWKTQDRFLVSNAAFGLSWIRDEGSVAELVKLSGDKNEQVRALATIALGHVGSTAPVDALTRCFENVSHRNRFGGFDILFDIAHIL